MDAIHESDSAASAMRKPGTFVNFSFYRFTFRPEVERLEKILNYYMRLIRTVADDEMFLRNGASEKVVTSNAKKRKRYLRDKMAPRPPYSGK